MDPRKRWIIGFSFGGINGFCFSSVLGEFGLSRAGLTLSVLSFNVGMEVGQMLVVAAIFALVS
jgi:hypothetical protein